jgi:hypothetical protein
VRYLIEKNHHRARPPHLAVWRRKYAIRKTVCFGAGCNYDLHSDDQEDTNKLFGLGYIPSWKLLFLFFSYLFAGLLWNEHHHDSARFGWLYKDGKIQINAYLYVAGKRIIEPLCVVPLGLCHEFHLVIDHDLKRYSFCVKDATGRVLADREFSFTHNKRFSFALGIFFGGNRAAPQDMIIEMKKL